MIFMETGILIDPGRALLVDILFQLDTTLHCRLVIVQPHQARLNGEVNGRLLLQSGIKLRWELVRAQEFYRIAIITMSSIRCTIMHLANL